MDLLRAAEVLLGLTADAVELCLTAGPDGVESRG